MANPEWDNYKPRADAEATLKWMILQLLTDSQLDVRPPNSKTTLRYMYTDKELRQ